MMVAETKGEIELVEVKAEDVIADHRKMYDAFMRMVPISIGATILLLVGVYVLWG
jgi:hypothetical protein